MSRMYVVTDTNSNGSGQSQFLVEADSQYQAIGIVVGSRYVAKAASTGDVVSLMTSGVKVTHSNKAPKQVQPELTGLEVTA